MNPYRSLWVLALISAVSPHVIADDADITESGRSTPVISAEAGILMGASFQDGSLNDRNYEAGGVVGPAIGVVMFRTNGIHFGVDGGYLYFSNRRHKGTDMLEMTTRYHRLDSAVSARFRKKAFALKYRMGAAVMILATRTRYETDSVVEVRKHRGASPGFLTGLGVGAEFGQSLFRWKRPATLWLQSDYVRRGRRNEFTAVFGISGVFWDIRSR